MSDARVFNPVCPLCGHAKGLAVFDFGRKVGCTTLHRGAGVVLDMTGYLDSERARVRQYLSAVKDEVEQ